MCYNAFIRSARFFPALLAMPARHAVLPTRSVSSRPTHLHSSRQSAYECPQFPVFVFKRLRTLSFCVSRKSCGCHSLVPSGAEGYENCRLCTNNSHFGSRGAICAKRTCGSPVIARKRLKFFLFKFLRTLLHLSKTQPFSFQTIPHSLHKTPGGVGRGIITENLFPLYLWLHFEPCSSSGLLPPVSRFQSPVTDHRPPLRHSPRIRLATPSPPATFCPPRCSIQCGGYGQVGRPTHAGREGGRRPVVRASPPALSDSAGQFPVPDGSEPGAGGRSRAGSFPSRVSRAERLRTQREVHHLVFPDRNEPGAELDSGHALPSVGGLHR